MSLLANSDEEKRAALALGAHYWNRQAMRCEETAQDRTKPLGLRGQALRLLLLYRAYRSECQAKGVWYAEDATPPPRLSLRSEKPRSRRRCRQSASRQT
jgi:hypothetical protein